MKKNSDDKKTGDFLKNDAKEWNVIKRADQLSVQVDPIVEFSPCSKDLEGYLYFQSGDELFRYRESSYIKLRLQSFSSNEKAISAVDYGCMNSPYMSASKLFFSIDPAQVKNNKDDFQIPQFESIYLESVQVGRKKIPSPDQELNEMQFENCKMLGFPISELKNNIKKCTVDSFEENSPFNKRPIYLRLEQNFYPSVLGRPFVMACENLVGQLVCRVHYRLYETIDLHYSFYKGDFDEYGIIVLDNYLRDKFLEMRVIE